MNHYRRIANRSKKTFAMDFCSKMKKKKKTISSPVLGKHILDSLF